MAQMALKLADEAIRLLETNIVQHLARSRPDHRPQEKTPFELGDEARKASRRRRGLDLIFDISQVILQDKCGD